MQMTIFSHHISRFTRKSHRYTALLICHICLDLVRNDRFGIGCQSFKLIIGLIELSIIFAVERSLHASQTDPHKFARPINEHDLVFQLWIPKIIPCLEL